MSPLDLARDGVLLFFIGRIIFLIYSSIWHSVCPSLLPLPEAGSRVCQIIVIVKAVFVLHRDVKQIQLSVVVRPGLPTGRPRRAHSQGRNPRE